MYAVRFKQSLTLHRERIFVLVDTLETYQPKLISTTSLVAQVVEGLTQDQSAVVWNKVDVLALQYAIENLEDYLDNTHKSLTQIKASKMDEADQVKYAPGIGIEIRKHIKAIEKAARVLRLGASLVNKIDQVHDPKIKSIASDKQTSLDLTSTNWHLSSYPSKFDAFLDSSIQIKRTSELYFHDVAFRNRSHRDETIQTLEELQKLVDENVLSCRKSSKPCGLNEHIKKWMISSRTVELDSGAIINRGSMADVYRGTYRDDVVAVQSFHGILSILTLKTWSTVWTINPAVVSSVFEWSPETILTFLDKRPTKLLPMVYELICGIVSIHDEGVIHGDLKPSNILVSAQNHIAISGFGVSKCKFSSMTMGELDQMINWSSPEMRFQTHSASYPTDVWSFAMIVYQLLSKRIPYNGHSVFEIDQALRSDTDRPRRPNDLNPAFYPLWQQLERCWKMKPDERPTAKQVQNFMENTYNVNRAAPKIMAINVKRAKNLKKTQVIGNQDPYVEIEMNGQLYKTITHNNGHTNQTLIQLQPPVEKSQKVHIRVMNANWKIFRPNEIAKTTVTIEQLLEARRHNREKTSPKCDIGFPLSPMGRIVVEACIWQPHDTAQYESTRIVMKHICAVQGTEDGPS
ncbi:hypothetical protein LEN26_018602 [Aphanomyces euteiches]|nr:hypothetical protein LEN26_018602 [Aphanomyces euteiches]